MSDAFKESNSNLYRQSVTFVTGFNVIADQPFQIGSSLTANSTLITYNQILPIGGISGYLRSGEGSEASIYGLISTGNADLRYLMTGTSGVFVDKVSAQTIIGAKTFQPDTVFKLYDGANSTTVIDFNNDNNFTLRGNFDGDAVDSIDVSTRQLINASNALSLDWQNRKLTGVWNVQDLNATQFLKISGQSVITGFDTSLLASATNLTTTGATLNNKINSLSGYITGNYISTGSYYCPTQLYSGFNPINIYWNSGNVFKFILTGNVTLNHVNARDGQTIVIGISNTGTKWFSGIWESNVHWPSNVLPTQSSGAKMDVYTAIKIHTGIYMNVVQGFGN